MERIARLAVTISLLAGCVAVDGGDDLGTLAAEVDGYSPYADQYACNGEDHCVGRPGRHCYGLPPLTPAPVDQLYSCESLRHDLSPWIDADGKFICLKEANKEAEGCCGTLEAAENALLAGTNFTRNDLRPSVIDCLHDEYGNPLPNCPAPEQFCSSGFTPDGPGIDFAASQGYTHVGPCSGERKVAYLPKFLSTDCDRVWTGDGYVCTGKTVDAELVVLPEPGRIMLGISGKGSGVIVVSLNPNSPLCAQWGLCTGSTVLDLAASNFDLAKWFLGQIKKQCYGDDDLEKTETRSGCSHMPFFQAMVGHGFGWYELPNLAAGTYAVISMSTTALWMDGHATADTYAYYGGGGAQRYPGCQVNPGGVAGDLHAAPEQCVIEPGATHCSTTIDWMTTGDLRMAAVFLRATGQQVAAGLSSSDPAYGGGIDLSWIGPGQHAFDLRQCGFAADMSDCSHATGPILDTVWITGVCGGAPACDGSNCGWQQDGCGSWSWCGQCPPCGNSDGDCWDDCSYDWVCTCGDGECNPSGEDSASCPEDCGSGGCGGPCDGGYVWNGDCGCHACWEWYQYCYGNGFADPQCGEAAGWCGF